jgi:predicted RNase H-like HicB family nuclease
MKDYNFTVVVERDEEGNFLAIVPALQGCYAEGSTMEEALELVKDAIALHIEDRLENGEPIYEEVFSGQLAIAV